MPTRLQSTCHPVLGAEGVYSEIQKWTGIRHAALRLFFRNRRVKIGGGRLRLHGAALYINAMTFRFAAVSP